MQKRKMEAIAIKRQRAKEEISLLTKEKKNYESDTKDKTDLDKVGKDKYLIQL